MDPSILLIALALVVLVLFIVGVWTILLQIEVKHLRNEVEVLRRKIQ